MLATLGVSFEAVVPEVEELREGDDPAALVVENARRKARAGLDAALEDASRKAEAGLRLGGGGGSVALGVDTEVVLEGRLLGKAGTVAEARERLLALSGRTHEVLSGVCLTQSERMRDLGPIGPPNPHSGGPAERTGVARSLVTLTQLSEPLLDLYLESGEWRGRAGAYAIQGLGSVLVERLEGDFSNVVGLPLQLLLELAPELFPGISSDSA